MPGAAAGMISQVLAGLLFLLALVFGMPPAQASTLAAIRHAPLRHAHVKTDEARPVATSVTHGPATPCGGSDDVHGPACCTAAPCAGSAGGLASGSADPSLPLLAGRSVPPAALSEPTPGIHTAPALPPPRRIA